MADNRSQASRSALMSRIGGRNTAPEVQIRKLLFKLGYRYRLHRKDLPGTPDIVFPSRAKVIFVHGCFWHAHGCRIGKLPKSRPEFWEPKLAGNKARDRRNVSALRKLGWSALSIWQCELKSPEGLEKHIRSFLGPPTQISIDKSHNRS
jgi:DNA mismatch endonuclease (patch repair protein)